MFQRCLEAAYEENRHLEWYLGGGGSPENQMARTVEKGHVSRRRAALARISACTCPKTLDGYFKQFLMQQSSASLRISSRSDCPHESLFKTGRNSNIYKTVIFGNEGQPLLFIWSKSSVHTNIWYFQFSSKKQKRTWSVSGLFRFDLCHLQTIRFPITRLLWL